MRAGDSAGQRVYPEPLDVGTADRWWDMTALRLDRAAPLRDARAGRIVGLYALHAGGEFVYVGHSSNVGARLAHHRRYAGPWVDRIRAAWMSFDDVDAARQVERIIAGSRYWHRPEWNRTGYGRGRRSAEIVAAWFAQRVVPDQHPIGGPPCSPGHAGHALPHELAGPRAAFRVGDW